MPEQLLKEYFDIWAQGLAIMSERSKYGFPINEGVHFYSGDDEI